MSPIRIAAFGTVTILSFPFFQTVGLCENPKPGQAEEGDYHESLDNSGLILAPIEYGDTMLVVVTDDGVAAIVFQKKDPELINGSAKYRFRFLKDTESEEITGGGIVLDSPHGKEEKTIKAGPIRVGWGSGGRDRGGIFYQPEECRFALRTPVDLRTRSRKE